MIRHKQDANPAKTPFRSNFGDMLHKAMRLWAFLGAVSLLGSSLKAAQSPLLFWYQEGASVIVSWPAASPGCILETANSVSGPFVMYPGIPVLHGDMLSVTVSPNASDKFFRLNCGGIYSLNMVGYINLAIAPGYNLIANQLKAAPDNSLA